MYNYRMIECGHAACFPCLEGWFSIQKRRYQPDPNEISGRISRVFDILDKMGQLKRSFFSRNQIFDICHPSFFANPIFSCPTCRKSVVLPPTSDEVLSEILLAIQRPPTTGYNIQRTHENNKRRWLVYFPSILNDI